MKPFKWFRWKAAIPLLVISAVTVIFCVFLLDGIVKSIVVSAGQAIFGAKVEIAKLNVGIIKPGITIKSLQVADKSAPMKNLFAADKIKFSVEFYPLLSKKLIIDIMSIQNLTWGTGRTTSGALPPSKVKKIEKRETAEDKDSFTYKLTQSLKQKASAEIQALPAVKSAKEIEQELKSLDPKKIAADFEANLTSKKAIGALQSESSQKYETYKNDIASLKLDETATALKQATAEISQIKIQTVQDAGPAGEKISQISEKTKATQETLAKLKALQAKAAGDFVAEKELAEKVNALIGEDYRALLASAKLPEINRSNIAEAIFGGMWLNRVNSTLRYVHLARKYFPPRKKNQSKLRFKRMRGTDVVFYSERALPGFLLREASISGTTGKSGAGFSQSRQEKGGESAGQLDVSGKITGVCSDPVLYGKPAVMEISGQKGARKYDLHGVFDHTAEIPSDTLTLNVGNLPVNGFTFGSGAIPPVETGTLGLNSVFNLTGEILDCKMEMTVDGIKFAASSSGSPSGDIIAGVLAEIKTIKVIARINGTTDNLKSSVSSNLDGIISDKLKAVYGKKAEEFKAKLKDELDNRVSAQKDKLLKDYSGQRQEILAIISGKETMISQAKKELDERIAAVKKQIEEKTAEEKRKLEQQAEEEKKKKEEEVKKKAEEELKKKAGQLFK